MALKKTADDYQDSFGKEAATTVKRNFYVDDLLKSQKTEESAVDLVKNVREMCASGGFKPTKFIFINRRALETILMEDHAEGLKDLDLKFDSLPIEIALGMLLNVENDILATVSSICSVILLVSLVPYYYLVDVFSRKFVVREKVWMKLSQMK